MEKRKDLSFADWLYFTETTLVEVQKQTGASMQRLMQWKKGNVPDSLSLTLKLQELSGGQISLKGLLSEKGKRAKNENDD